MIIDISILILVGIVLTTSIVGGKWYWQYRLKAEKVAIQQEKETKNPANQIDSIIDNLPAILEQRQKDYEDVVKAHGENDPVAKSYKQQIDLLKMASSVPEPVLNLLKPVAMRAIRAISDFKL